MSTSQTRDDPEVISWDIAERSLPGGSAIFDVIGTSDQCRVSFFCADEATAESLAALLNSRMVCGARAERLVSGERPPTKTCPRCRDDFPADAEFFRVRAVASGDKPPCFMAWCRACEAEQKAESRAAAGAAIAKMTGRKA